MALKTITPRDDGLYVGLKQLTEFIPHVNKVKKTLTSSGFQMSYLLSICQNGKQVDTITTKHLYIKSWFALSRYCPDAALSQSERKLIEEFLEKEAATLPIHLEIFLDQYGWHTADFGNTFYRNRIITDNVDLTMRSAKSDADMIRTEMYNFEVHDCAALLQNIKEMALGSSWLLYMTSYFDILKKLFRKAGYPIQFITNVYGKSGSGKTSEIRAICSPSKAFSFRSAKRRDTILHELSEYTGHTILIDDYHPAESRSDRERQAGLKDSLVRAVEEIDDFPNIIISSEYLDGHTSMQDREIQIFLDDNLNWQLLHALEQRKNELEEVRTAFYVQIVSHADDVIKTITAFCTNRDNNCAIHNQTRFRSIRYSNYILCTNYLFQKYFIENYNINFQMPDLKTDLAFQLERQLKHMQIIRDLENQGTWLIALRNMLQCRGIFNQIPDYTEYIPSADTIHINSRGEISISPNALQRGMMIYLQTNHVPIKQIVKELHDAEALITYDNPREHTKKHNGKRVYVINTDALNEYCSFFE